MKSYYKKKEAVVKRIASERLGCAPEDVMVTTRGTTIWDATATLPEVGCVTLKIHFRITDAEIRECLDLGDNTIEDLMLENYEIIPPLAEKEAE